MAANTPSTLSGLFKEAYGDSVINLIPEAAKLVKMVPFVPRDKETGNKYHQPVILSNEQGVTYAAFNAGAFTLNAALPMAMQDAQVSPSQMLLRSALSYDAAARASNGVKAFIKATELLVENMMESITKRLEISCFYGNSGIGGVDSTANASATTSLATFLAAEWATGIWAGSETAQVQFYRKDTGALVSSGSDSIFTVTTVDSDAKQILFTGTATGITALDIASAASDLDVYWNGSKNNEMDGINKIITNTGTLFNINAAQYNLWKGNTQTAGGSTLTMGRILTGASKAQQRGLNEKAAVFMNPNTWTNVMSDLAAQRKFDGSYDRKQGTNGFENVRFYSQNGELELIPHNIIKEGEAFLFPLKKTMRIGAQEISFKTPGREDDIFTQLADAAGYELRVYTDQSVFLETPARATKFIDIVNS